MRVDKLNLERVCDRNRAAGSAVVSASLGVETRAELDRSLGVAVPNRGYPIFLHATSLPGNGIYAALQSSADQPSDLLVVGG